MRGAVGEAEEPVGGERLDRDVPAAADTAPVLSAAPDGPEQALGLVQLNLLQLHLDVAARGFVCAVVRHPRDEGTHHSVHVFAHAGVWGRGGHNFLI